jgi:hypothetical protein
MPSFHTVAEAHSYCSSHFPWWKETFYGDLVIAALGYIVGRLGLETVWSWIKSSYSWIRNIKIGKATPVTPTQTQVVTPVAGTPAPAAA